MIAEQKLRTQRILGVLLKDSEKRNGARDGKTGLLTDTPLLSDYGINKKQSSTFQQIAGIPERKFEAFIMEKKKDVDQAVTQ